LTAERAQGDVNRALMRATSEFTHAGCKVSKSRTFKY
jgi:hypothetical protein